MKTCVAVMFAVGLSAALVVPVAADSLEQKAKSGVQKTKDVAERVEDKIENKAKNVKDRVVGHKTEGSEDHHGAMMNQDVMTAQQALKDQGRDPGTIDGRMGPRTRAALTDYQQSEGLKVTGRLDGDTRAKLGM